MVKCTCLSDQVLSATTVDDRDVDREILDHLESCTACRERLESLTAEESWWRLAETLPDSENLPAHRIARSVCPLEAAKSGSESPGVFDTGYELELLRAKIEPATHPELLGRIGRYEIEQLVGAGGMGLVFRGHDTELHRIVAVKTIASSLAPHGAVRQRFLAEARAVASLAHPHIVSVHDIVHEDPVPAIVMQYVAGPSLGEHIAKNGALHWRNALQLGTQLCDALETAHRSGLIHRDIKPGNVLLEANATRALLTDFGLVRVLDQQTVTRSGTLAGTPEFMSPEQAWGRKLDARSDLFSLGSVLYVMLTGISPFAAGETMATLNRLCNDPHRPIRELAPDVPRQVIQLVDRLLAKQTRRRYSSAAEVRERMQDLLHSDITLTPRRRTTYTVLGIAAMFLVAALIGLPFTPVLRDWIASKARPEGVVVRVPDRLPGSSFSAVRVPGTPSSFGAIVQFDRELQGVEGDLSSLERLFDMTASDAGLFGSSHGQLDAEIIAVERLLSELESDVAADSQ